MSVIASEITGNSTVCSNGCPSVHQSSLSLALFKSFHTRIFLRQVSNAEMFSCNDIIMSTVIKTISINSSMIKKMEQFRITMNTLYLYPTDELYDVLWDDKTAYYGTVIYMFIRIVCECTGRCPIGMYHIDCLIGRLTLVQMLRHYYAYFMMSNKDQLLSYMYILIPAYQSLNHTFVENQLAFDI